MRYTFRRLLTVLYALTLCAGTALAQWSRVWEEPAVDYHVLGNQFTITRVEMNERQTLVSFHCWIGTVEPVDFIKVFMLRSAGKEYTAQSATGITLGQDIIMPENCNLDFTVAFEPFAEEVTSFDCEIQGVLTIENVRDRHAPKADLADTYWRNAATGDWLIGFADDAVIYDTRIWDIVSSTERKGAFDYTVRNGNEELLVRIGKEKRGRRNIRIGEAKATACERITSRLMPPYPVHDTRPALADNGYHTGDSVTIVGWYRNMNEQARKCGREFSVRVPRLCPTDIIRDVTNFSVPIDSLGRFTIRIPVENTSQLRADWRRSRWMLLVEPGETYFLLKDFATDQMLVMGRDARVQNEVLANHHVTKGAFFWPEAHIYVKKIGAMGYLAKADSAYRRRLQSTADVPNLSERYRVFHRNSTLAELGRWILKARFEESVLPEDYINYATDSIFKRLEGSYHIGFSAAPEFIGQYTEMLERKHIPYTPFSAAMQIAEEEGIATFSADEWQTVNDYNREAEIEDKAIKEAKSDEERQRILEANNAKPISRRMMELVKKHEGLYEATDAFLPLYKYRKFLSIVDSLDWTQLQRDIYLSQSLCKLIDTKRSALVPRLLDLAKTEIKLPLALAPVLAMHNNYANIARKTLSASSLYSNDDLQGLSEGEQILRRILEPMRGKMVLLDVWGTWCGPCKDALSHSQEEYKRLQPYDIVYLYLANKSPEESWRNVIKEYNVQGDNVVHYNLPYDQQKAVENFLKVSAFPTYRLIDAEGHILDVNADPRNLDALERVIKQVTGK